VQAALRADPKIQAVCLLGDAASIPHVTFEDLTGHDDAVLADHPYGARAQPDVSARYAGDLLGDVPVTRIPTDDPALVSRLLSVGASLPPPRTRGVAVTAEVWEGASRAVIEGIGGPTRFPLLMVPPDSAAAVGERLGPAVGRVYCNVHGSNLDPRWYGHGRDGSYPVALAPEVVRVAPDAVVVSEACYGAAVGSSSIAMRFLQHAGCFVGSTIIAWGPANPPIGLADLIVTGFYAGLDSGLPVGQALLSARRQIRDHYLQRGEALDPAAHNTLCSFVAYGAPMARVRGTRVPRPTRSTGGRVAGPPKTSTGGSALDRVRRQMASGRQGALGAARGRLRDRLPPDAWRVLSSGRLKLADLSRHFRTHGELQRELDGLLAARATTGHLVRYRAGLAERGMVTAATGTGPQRRAALLVVDGQGRILRRFVSR